MRRLLPFASHAWTAWPIFALGLAPCVVSGLGACGSDSSSTESAKAATSSLFVVPGNLDELDGLHFFDHPWPSDLRRDADGSAHWAGWPNPVSVPLVTQYIDDTKGLLHGFSPVAAAYLRFTGPIDPSSLPADPPASIANDAAIQIIDVDPASPERGTRKLAQFRWQESEGVYLPANTLAVLPMLGRPLRPSTRYAIVATNKLRAAGGGPVNVSAELQAVLGRSPVTPQTSTARDLFAPAIAEIAQAGVAADDVVHLTVFTTNDPTSETFAIMDDIHANVPAPTARDWQRKETRADYDVYEGVYGPSPNYQAGNIPFEQPADGGGFVFENGKPKVQNTFDPRFALAVPNATRCPMPTAGYPIVVYAHGTGGDYRSFIGDGTAQALAQRCLASIGTDQIFHGTRPGAPAPNDPSAETTIQLLFFNLNNPLAARSSNRQSSVDVAQEARLFGETHVVVPAAQSTTGQDIAFDASRILFFGHSQGGLNGPLFLAGSSSARGGVLSGAGSVLGVALLEKTEPVDIAATFRFLVGLNAETGVELDAFHPIITLAQSLVDTADPIHYGSFITRAPRPGASPKSIFQTEGIRADGSGDSYAPPHGIEALAVAIGLPRLAPGIRPIQEAGWAALGDVNVPADGLSGNLASGQASGAIAQFVPAANSDGHFVVFDVPAARAQAAQFCRNLADDPRGRIPAP